VFISVRESYRKFTLHTAESKDSRVYIIIHDGLHNFIKIWWKNRFYRD